MWMQEDQLNFHQHQAMKLNPKGRLFDHFSEIEDPRIERTKRHKLIDILTIAILAVIRGADGWVGMESFGQAKHSWLRRILELPNGIPSHDTVARVLARLNPEHFQACFLRWVRSGQTHLIQAKPSASSLHPTRLEAVCS